MEPGIRKLMAARIDRDDSLPVYAQIANAIRGLVTSGTLAPGTMLPPERVLCDDFGVSRMTLRQAYDVLERENILNSQRGRGTSVSPQRMRKQQQEMRSFSEEVRASGATPSSKLVAFETIVPPLQVREDLSMPAGERAYRFERIRFSDKTPMAIEVVQIPCYLCPGLERVDLSKRSLYAVMESDYGLQLAHSLENISATLPSPRSRKLLELPRGAAVLTIERKTYTSTGTPAEVAVTTYRGDLYQAVVHSVRSRTKTEGQCGYAGAARSDE